MYYKAKEIKKEFYTETIKGNLIRYNDYPVEDWYYYNGELQGEQPEECQCTVIEYPKEIIESSRMFKDCENIFKKYGKDIFAVFGIDRTKHANYFTTKYKWEEENFKV